MPVYFDLKRIPEVAGLPIDHRARIERRSLSLAATDGQTICVSLVMVFLLPAGGRFQNILPEGLRGLIDGTLGLAGVVLFLFVFFMRANHHAVRISRLTASSLASSEPDGRPEYAPTDTKT